MLSFSHFSLFHIVAFGRLAYCLFSFIPTVVIFESTQVSSFCSGGGVVVYADSRIDPSVADEQNQAPTKKKVVVLGTGWAGTSFLKNLDSSMYDVHVVSPRNYFAFTPLLPSVTCGTVDARSIVEPVRNIIRKV